MVSPGPKENKILREGNGRPVVSVISEKPRRRNAKTYLLKTMRLQDPGWDIREAGGQGRNHE